MQNRVSHLTAPFRLGFLVRLSVLLVAQIVFLFSAFALVIFVPENKPERERGSAEMSRLLGEIASAIGGISITDSGVSLESAAGQVAGTKLVNAARVQRFSITCASPDRRTIFEWRASTGSTEESLVALEPDTDQIATLISLVANMPHGYQLHLTEHKSAPLYIERFDLANLGPVVLAAEETTDVVADSRANLMDTIILLFLVSTLISLLIVYLLWKRLQQPLENLTQIVEATARGDMAHSVDTAAEEQEITRLANGLSQLADHQQRDHKAAQVAGEKLQEASTALRESQHFLQTIIDRSPSGMIVTDSGGKIVILNHAAAKEFGYSSAESIGKGVESLFVIPAESIGASGEQSGFETVCWRRDGDSFPAYIVSASVETAGAGQGARVYILRDIVESRGYQDMMVRLDRNAARGAMAADIGHEINNFLAVVLGNLELLPRAFAKGDEAGIKKKLETMKVNVEKIARFADGLMVESANDDLQTVSMSVNQIVENVISFLRFQNRFDGVDWVVQLRPDLPMAEIDDARVQQVLVNLLYNAAEAVGEIEGNHVLTVTTRPGVHGNTPVVHVDVVDNGPGVQQDKETLLFRSRFTTKKQGHGFGLMTCRKLVEQHGGWIGYQFENGAHFWFELPLEQAAVNQASATAPAALSV